VGEGDGAGGKEVEASSPGGSGVLAGGGAHYGVEVPSIELLLP
jgi:hypothetical protein